MSALMACMWLFSVNQRRSTGTVEDTGNEDVNEVERDWNRRIGWLGASGKISIPAGSGGFLSSDTSRDWIGTSGL